MNQARQAQSDLLAELQAELEALRAQVQQLEHDLTREREARHASEMRYRLLVGEDPQPANDPDAALSGRGALLHTLIENIPDAIYHKDLQGRFLTINSAQAHHLGLQNPQDALDKTDFDFLDAAHSQKAREDEQRIIATGEPVVDQLEEYIDPHGRHVFISTTKVPLHDADGRVVGIVGVSRDITEREQDKQNLLRLNADLIQKAQMIDVVRTVLDAMPSMVWYLDQQGTILHLNDAAARLLGKSIEELENTPVAALHPAHLRRHLMIDRPMIESGQAVRGQFYTFITSSGEMTALVDKVPVFGRHGRLSGVLVIATDITDYIAAQRAMAESEEKYRLLFQSETDSILLLDIQTHRFIETNPAALKLYGYTDEEFRALHLTDITSAAPEELEARIRRLLLGEALQIPLSWHRRKNGERFPVEISAAGYLWQERVVACIIVRDITERQRDQARIIDQNQQLLALQSAAMAITSSLEARHVLNTIVREVVRLLDTESCSISAWNAEEQFLYEIARYDSDGWLPEAADVPRYYLADYPETRRVIEEQRVIQQVINQPDPDPVEQRYLRENGLTILIMVPIIFRGRVFGIMELEDPQRVTPFSDEEITIVQLLANQAGNALENARLYAQAQEEIAERKRAEAALRESEARYRILIEASPVPIIMYDLDHHVTYVNPAFEQTFGWTLAEVVGKPLDFAPPDLAESREQLHQQMLAEGKVESIDTRRLTKDGRMLDIQASASLYYDPSGSPQGSITILYDITAHKQARERELALALEHERVNMLTSFIKDASHDFRTPLSTISTSLYLLGKQTDPQRRERHLNVLQKQVDHLEKLVDGLFTLARLDSSADMRFRRTRLSEVLEQVKAKALFLAQQKGLEVRFAQDGSDPVILADPIELFRALMGIITNAVQYTPQGEVHITSGTRHHQAYIEIRDTGVGISAEDLPRIFDRFFRADRARSTQTGGLGLDLSIAKKIVENHDGTIEARSELGKGSTFTVYLPLEA